MKYMLIYLLVINVIAYIFYAVDKRKAIKGKWRISEATLIAFSVIGGGLGSLLAMKVVRHKTQKMKFKILVPLFTILSIVGLYYIYITVIN